MIRKNIPHKTLRFLYAKSGNRCAFPGCNTPIFEDNGLLTGECCHIEAVSKGGARYNDTTTEDEKNSESNLILMCSRHHTIIDSDSSTYTTDVLKKMKADHEQQFSGTKRELDEKMLFALEQSMARHWDRLQKIDNIENHLKIKVDKDASIESLLANIEESFSNIERLLKEMAHSDEKLPNDARELCEKVGVDYERLEQVPYFENCLIGRLWESHNLAVPNSNSHLKMYYLQFCVNVFAELAKHDKAYLDILKQYQDKLEAHQKQNYYVD